MLNWTKHVCLLVWFCGNKLPPFSHWIVKTNISCFHYMKGKRGVSVLSLTGVSWTTLWVLSLLQMAEMQDLKPYFTVTSQTCLDGIMIKSCPLTFFDQHLPMWLSSKVKIGLRNSIQVNWYNNEWKSTDPITERKNDQPGIINSMYHNDFNPILPPNCTSYWSYFLLWYVNINPSEILFYFFTKQN